MNQSQEFLEFVRGRRSVRKFREDPVDREVLDWIVEVASWAFSASNRQDWEFAFITSLPIKKKMGEMVRARWKSILEEKNVGSVTEELQPYSKNFDWFSDAPVLMVISAKRPQSFLYHLLGDAAEDVAGTKLSAAMAAQNVMLAAHAAGLGSCCITGALVAQDSLRELLGLGQRKEIVCLVALGYPAEQPVAPSRKPLERILRYVE